MIDKSIINKYDAFVVSLREEFTMITEPLRSMLIAIATVTVLLAASVMHKSPAPVGNVEFIPPISMDN